MNFAFASSSLPFSMVRGHRTLEQPIVRSESAWRANPASWLNGFFWHGGRIDHQDGRQRSEAKLGDSEAFSEKSLIVY
jgi:hypothetical protein